MCLFPSLDAIIFLLFTADEFYARVRIFSESRHFVEGGGGPNPQQVRIFTLFFLLLLHKSDVS